jgi:uncharacterized integral membrane protein
VKWVKTLFWMVLFFFVVHFSIQNRDEVTLRYSIQNYQCFEVSKVPLFLVVLCSVFLGVLIGGLGDLYSRFRLKKSLHKNQKAIERLEREIQSLRGPGLDQPSFLLKKNN